MFDDQTPTGKFIRTLPQSQSGLDQLPIVVRQRRLNCQKIPPQYLQQAINKILAIIHNPSPPTHLLGEDETTPADHFNDVASFKQLLKIAQQQNPLPPFNPEFLGHPPVPDNPLLINPNQTDQDPKAFAYPVCEQHVWNDANITLMAQSTVDFLNTLSSESPNLLVVVDANVWSHGIAFTKDQGQEAQLIRQTDILWRMPNYAKHPQDMPHFTALELWGYSYRITANFYKPNLECVAVHLAFAAALDLRSSQKAQYARVHRDETIRYLLMIFRIQCAHAITLGCNKILFNDFACDRNNNPYLIAAIIRLVMQEPRHQHLQAIITIANAAHRNLFKAMFDADPEWVKHVITYALPTGRQAPGQLLRELPSDIDARRVQTSQAPSLAILNPRISAQIPAPPQPEEGHERGDEEDPYGNLRQLMLQSDRPHQSFHHGEKTQSFQTPVQQVTWLKPLPSSDIPMIRQPSPHRINYSNIPGSKRRRINPDLPYLPQLDRLGNQIIDVWLTETPENWHRQSSHNMTIMLDWSEQTQGWQRLGDRSHADWWMRNTSLLWHMPNSLNVLEQCGYACTVQHAITTTHVEAERDDKYDSIPILNLTLIAAPDLRPHTTEGRINRGYVQHHREEYIKHMLMLFRLQYEHALEQGSDLVILTDLGCEYGHNPYLVAIIALCVAHEKKYCRLNKQFMIQNPDTAAIFKMAFDQRFTMDDAVHTLTHAEPLGNCPFGEMPPPDRGLTDSERAWKVLWEHTRHVGWGCVNYLMNALMQPPEPINAGASWIQSWWRSQPRPAPDDSEGKVEEEEAKDKEKVHAPPPRL